MRDLKISLITVVFNAENTIKRCIESIISQKFPNVEYIVIDGASTDKTVDIIQQYSQNIHHFVSEPDKGIYDAMNKGIKMATGDVVGTLNADDFFAHDNALSLIASSFQNNNSDTVYADLDYVDENDKIIRKWRSGNYNRRNFQFGWMPPHPTFYCKRIFFEKLGYYSLDYGTAADYELMLRFLYVHKLSAIPIRNAIVKMKTGGKSNNSFLSRVKGMKADLKAMQKNKILLPVLTLVAKPLRKVIQYL